MGPAGQAAGLGLADLLGRQRDQVPVYASGVNRHLTLDELTEQVSRWVAAGHTRFKIKVGRPGLDEDLERVAAVRRIIGPGRLLMVDANQLWDLPTARRAATALSPYRHLLAGGAAAGRGLPRLRGAAGRHRHPGGGG